MAVMLFLRMRTANNLKEEEELRSKTLGGVILFRTYLRHLLPVLALGF